MNLVFMDRTGDIEGRIWDDAQKYASMAAKDRYVQVEGKIQSYQNRKQIVVHKLHALRDDEVTAGDYFAESSSDFEGLHAKLLEFVASMEDPHYRRLAESVLKDDVEVIAGLKNAPAAKTVHHAFRGGLLEHMVSVSGLLDRVARHYEAGKEKLNRDLLLLGGFFHDIGKIWELSYEKVTDYTTEGRLIGHLVMGVELIEKKVNELSKEFPEGFPTDKKLLAKHMVLAHHGKLEFGSPKEPQVLEALVVHMIDDLDSKINAIQTFIESDLAPGNWTGLNRMYERYFYKTPKT
jgi:3'-5' exoribonuclease